MNTIIENHNNNKNMNQLICRHVQVHTNVQDKFVI